MFNPALVGAALLALLALFALLRKRWAFLAFVLLGILYLPAQTGFHVHAPKCDLATTLTTRALVRALHDYTHIAVFAVFAWISWVQFHRARARFVWTVLATLLAGALLEIAEGVTGRGQCRVRDLVPAAAAALGMSLLLALWSRLRRRPGYVRIVKPRGAGAPRPVAPPTRPVAPPPRPAIPQPGWVVPPSDFSPNAPPAAPTEEVEPTEPTEERRAAPTGAVSVQQKGVQVLRAILQWLRALLAGLWAFLRRRSLAIVIVLLLAVAGAAAVVFVMVQAPGPVVVEQPQAPPPPPPRPLQADAEGYYEPSYQFRLNERRFTRLTLRPEPFVTFERLGTRQEAGCANAVVRADIVRLRCELDRVGIISIDGRFLTRFTTSRLDAPVLNALIEIRNQRGEVLYRARDSFRWHEPD